MKIIKCISIVLTIAGIILSIFYGAKIIFSEWNIERFELNNFYTAMTTTGMCVIYLVWIIDKISDCKELNNKP